MFPPQRLGIAMLVLASVLVTHVASARAQASFACLDGLSDEEVRYRLRFIEQHIEEHSRYSNFWWWGWLTVIGAAGVGYWGAFALTGEQDDPHEYRRTRERLFINALGATLLTTQLSVFAMTSAHAKRKLRRMPNDTPEARRVRLGRATVLLERAAKRQALGTSPMAHIGGPLWGIGTGSYLASRGHAPFWVASAFVMPLVVSEVRILTQPRAAMDAWRQYRAMGCHGRSGYAIPLTPSPPRADWDIVAAPGGLAFRLTF